MFIAIKILVKCAEYHKTAKMHISTKCVQVELKEPYKIFYPLFNLFSCSTISFQKVAIFVTGVGMSWRQERRG